MEEVEKVRKSFGRYFSQALCNVTLRIGAAILLDDLDCAFRALDFACSAHQTLFRFGWDGFLVLDLEDAYGASINTRAASSALSIIHDYFHHVQSLLKLKFH
jgi:hypothetical protein